MRLPEERVEGLVELAERRRLRAQAALLEDHVALGVELAEDGVQQAVRLQPRPQLERFFGTRTKYTVQSSEVPAFRNSPPFVV